MKRHLICFTGGQGSGKSTQLTVLQKLLNPGYHVTKFGIKNTFAPYADEIINALKGRYKVSPLAMKKLYLAISTWGETEVNRDIWSNEYLDMLSSGITDA